MSVASSEASQDFFVFAFPFNNYNNNNSQREIEQTIASHINYIEYLNRISLRCVYYGQILCIEYYCSLDQINRIYGSFLWRLVRHQPQHSCEFIIYLYLCLGGFAIIWIITIGVPAWLVMWAPTCIFVFNWLSQTTWIWLEHVRCMKYEGNLAVRCSQLHLSLFSLCDASL